jgi:hypothetical protein
MRGRKPCIHHEAGLIKGEQAATRKINPKKILMDMIRVLDVLLSQCLAILKNTKNYCLIARSVIIGK